MISGKADDVGPDALGVLPVLVLVLAAVGAHEGVHQGHVHLLGRHDHRLEMADDLLPMCGIGMQRVGVVAEPGDRESLRVDLVDDLAGLGRRQVGDVDMARAGVSPRLTPLRGQQAISSTSKPDAAAQSATSTSGVSGNGAVRKPSFMREPPPGSVVAWSTLARTLDPPAALGAGLDRVADEHLFVAVRERRVDRAVRRPAGRDVGVHGPEAGAEGVGKALDVAARAGAPPHAPGR